jgi:hypothetical protein
MAAVDSTAIASTVRSAASRCGCPVDFVESGKRHQDESNGDDHE